MRTPATVADFLRCALATVAQGQAALLGVLAVYFLILRAIGTHSAALPGWYAPLAVAIVPIAVAVVWTQWRRGDLDTYQVRRRRPRSQSADGASAQP